MAEKQTTKTKKIKWQNILLMAGCALVSVLLWVYVVGVENPEDTVEITGIPVQFIGEDILSDRNLLVTEGQDMLFSVQVTGRRGDLARLSRDNIPITVDLSSIKSTGDHTIRPVVTLPDNVREVGRAPYYFRVSIDNKAFKLVEVKAILDGNIAEGFIGDPPVVDPPFIRVNGPEAELEQVSHALVILRRENVEQSIEAVMPYVLIDTDGNELRSPTLTCDADEVLVRLNVNMIKDVSLDVEITEGGGVDLEHIEVKITPASIQLAGDPAILGTLNKILLGAIDLGQLAGSESMTFPITIENGLINKTGITEAVVTVTFKDIASREVTTTHIEVHNLPEGLEYELITQQVTVMLRGPSEIVSRIQSYNLRVFVDLQASNLTPGKHTVEARVYVEVSGVGVMGLYQVSIDLRVPDEGDAD